VVRLLPKFDRERTHRERVMAERKPIFVNKGSLTQIAYIDGNEAFDLSGIRRCIYNAETGNLYEFDTDKIIGHVSLQGMFVGASWIAAELFGQHAAGKGDLPSAPEMPPASSSEDRRSTTAAGHTANNDVAAPEEPEELQLLERAIDMVVSAFNKGRS
jgi:hypothetical protein